MKLRSLILLCAAAPLLPAAPQAGAGPAMTEDALFAELDLSRPGLEPVAAAIKSNDRAAARHALAGYYRHRATPLYFIAPGEKANPKPARPDTAGGDREPGSAVLSKCQSMTGPKVCG